MTLLEEAQNIIEGQRKNDYGSAQESFGRIATIWSAILGVPVSPKQVALCMVGMKCARLAATIDHRDSWVDVIGYAALVDQLESTEQL